MVKIGWKITASVGLMVFSQTASMALNGCAALAAGNPVYQNVSQPNDPGNDPRSIAAVVRDFSVRLNNSDARPDLDRASAGLLAQAEAPAASAVPAASATTPLPDSKGPHDQSPPAISSPPNPTSQAAVIKPGPTVVGCGLKYLSAELAGKLKGRKWKQFSQEECGPITTHAVFPATIAPKYSGEKPDKARTLTCADQFNVNKATNANDGLKWIEKGGGYYSECISRLKG
jgi:hypothetical protein